MKLHQKIFGIGLLTAVIVPHLYDKGYIMKLQYKWAMLLATHLGFIMINLTLYNFLNIQ